MPPKRVPDPPEEVVVQLDLATINDKLNQLAKEMHAGFQIRDEQSQLSNRVQEDRFQQLMTMMEKMNRSIKGKDPEIYQSSHSSHMSTTIDRGQERRDDPNGTGRNDRYADQQTNQMGFMARVDLPLFDGSKVGDWLEHCKFYFDYYQTPEIYKVQMATMNFVGDAAEWFSCYRVEHPDPPWADVVEAIFERFKLRTHLNPVVQFKRVQQTGTVDDYVREFQRAKARLMIQTDIKNDYFFVSD